MILRPKFIDFKIIGFYLGKIIGGLAIFMAIPMTVSFVIGEINPLFDFITSFLFCVVLALGLNIFCYTEQDPKWSHGMIVVSLSWIIASLVGAVPLFLSGHFNSFLDATFEAMSGFTTSGLTLANDLAHMSYAHNLWRHLTHFIGGQGIVVVILSFFVKGVSGAFRLYVGEARDEKVLPNIRQTARFIWGVSFLYLIIGTIALGFTAMAEGITPHKAFFHGICLFMAAFDTGGFTPQIQNVMYYHSMPIEIVSMMVMVLGSINFRLHYVLWTGQPYEIRRDFEIITFFLTIMCLTAFVALGLSRLDLYHSSVALFRNGFFQTLSAHTGTGFQTIYPIQFIHDWGSLAVFGIICAMSLGGCVNSTTGGIKALRLGIVGKAFINDVKHYVSPESAVFVQKIWHIKDMILSEKQMRAACMVLIAYVSTFFVGGVIGMLCGYPFVEALFESTSATANVGLSCGITSPSMPDALKITYIIQMWAGRLEFISVFALMGFIYALIKGR